MPSKAASNTLDCGMIVVVVVVVVVVVKSLRVKLAAVTCNLPMLHVMFASR